MADCGDSNGAEAPIERSQDGAEAMDTEQSEEQQQGSGEGGSCREESEGEGSPGLNELQEALSTAAAKWYQLGLQLGLDSTALHDVESFHVGSDNPVFLEEMLKAWLKKDPLECTWSAVVGALRQIGEVKVSNTVAEKYCGKEGEKEPVGNVPSHQTQKEEIHVLLQQRLQKGDSWYLVDVRWMKQWKKYVGYDTWDQSNAGLESANPGPIDNSNLFKDRTKEALKDHLMEELDYSLLPEPAWCKLSAWYGLSDDSQPISRKVVEYGLYMKHCKVEVYLLEFKLSMHKSNEVVNHRFSRASTVADMEAKLRSIFSVREETECRVWHRYMTNTYELLTTPTQTLQDAGLYNGQTIVLEKKNEDGSWPRMAERSTYGTRSTDSITGSDTASHSSSSYNTRSSSASASGTSGYGSSYGGYWSGSYSQQPSNPGLCGLSNLGNTCFMNSALQCLSNTQPMSEYFLGSKAGYKPYKKHINKDNPLGMGGAIAEAYGGLLEEVWSGKFGCVAPRNFKTQVGRYAPRFVGYAQHDSQELLAFLLDGLHEDLNLVREKPYVDMSVVTEGRADKDVAEESWHKYLLRNQSVVVRVFQGQLKSTLICPDCHKKSKIFDPFMFLSLPLPIKKTRKMFVCLVRADPTTDVYKYKVQVPKRGCVMDIKNELRKLTDISTDRMVLVDVYNSRFHRIYTNQESLSHILDRDDIYVYELSHPLGDPDWVHVPVYHREQIVREVRYTYQSYSQRYHQLFGLPAVVRVPRQQCTYRTLYDAISQRCCCFIKPWSEVKEKAEENIPDKDTKQEAMEIDRQDGAAENGNETAEQHNEAVNKNSSCHDNNTPEDSSTQEDGDKTEGGGESGEGEVKEKEEEPEKQDSVMDQFQLVVVNSYGSQDVQKLKDDSNPLRLSTQTYIACDWSTEVKDKCYDLEAAEEVKEHSTCAEQQAEARKNIGLEDCLNLFLAEETLGKDDAWYCPECKELVQASKKFDLWKLPEILVIHLKRFSYDRYWRDKLDVMVEFPMSGLDLTSYVQNPDDPEPVYDLFAVSNHFGGMGGGHYTAYCKNKETGKWHNFDDSHVSETSEDHVMTAAAYVLFYRRRMEGRPVPHILDRSLSQSFAEEVRQRKARYQPEGGSHSEEGGEEKGEQDSKERKRSRNKSTDEEEEVFQEAPEDMATSETGSTALDEPD